MQEKKKNSIKTAKIMTLIPLVTFVVTIVLYILTDLLEKPTMRGELYVNLFLVAIIITLLAPLPCLALSIIGVVFAGRARKEGTPYAMIWLSLGIAEILSSVLLGLLVLMIPVLGEGV